MSHLEAPEADAAFACNPSNAACKMSFGLARAARLAGKGKHAAALATARELTKTEFATMTAVRVSVRDKRPLPTVDGLCTPDLDVCSEDRCAGIAMPLPVTGQLGYLNTDALALIEQTGLPTFADAITGKPPQCQGKKPTTFAWALRDASSAPDAGVARVRALLLVQCGMVDARDGDYLATQPQLLVYDADGRLEIVSGLLTTAALDWEKGPEGPKLARGSVTGAEKHDDMQVDAVVAIANQ